MDGPSGAHPPRRRNNQTDAQRRWGRVHGRGSGGIRLGSSAMRMGGGGALIQGVRFRRLSLSFAGTPLFKSGVEEERDGNLANRRVSLPADRLLPLPSATARNVLEGPALLDAMRATIDTNVRMQGVREASFD